MREGIGSGVGGPLDVMREEEKRGIIRGEGNKGGEEMSKGVDGRAA